jgi:aldose 1-epimerase
MSFDSLSITDAASGSTARVLPQLGFNCYQWQVVTPSETRDMLWYDPALLEGTAKPTRSGIPLLFPFPGRIGGPQISFGGKKYDIADHLDDFGNPIHGFVMKRPWRIYEQAENRVTGEFQASVDEPALLEKWPADFRIRVTYQISANTLRSEFAVHNPDDKLLPFGLGTHAYFRVPFAKNSDAKQCVLTVPARYDWVLTDKLMPSTEVKMTSLAEQLNQGLTVGDTALDNLLTDLTFVNRTCTTSLEDPAANRKLTVRFGDEFANCVVFIPPHREAVCIEPYTTVPDAFHLQTMGVDARLRLLAPGSTWKAWVEMQFN